MSDILLYTITDANFTANAHKLDSSEEFGLSFRISSPLFNEKSVKELGKIFTTLLPAIKHDAESIWGDNKEYSKLDCVIDEVDHRGLCRHLVVMFKDAGVDVRCNGYAYQEHPLFKSMAEPEGVPPQFKTMKDLDTLIRAVIEKGTEPESAPQAGRTPARGGSTGKPSAKRPII